MKTPNTAMKTPNTKLQTPKKIQISSSKAATSQAELRFGYWDFSGVWSLVFGVLIAVFGVFTLLSFQDLADGGDGVPTARRGGKAQMFFDDRVGIQTGSTRSPKTQCKTADDPDNSDLPLFASGLIARQTRGGAARILHHTHEMAHVLA